MVLPASGSLQAPLTPLHCRVVPTVYGKSNLQFMGCDKNCPQITEAAGKESQGLDQSSMNLLEKSQNNQIFPLTDNPRTFSLLALKDAEPQLSCLTSWPLANCNLCLRLIFKIFSLTLLI